MLRSVVKISALLLVYIVCNSCNNKPKAVSGDVTKTAITINGKKDSVINNPQKNYGNATVAGPCVKCLIQVIQSTGEYKKAVASKPATAISYVVNWAEGANVGDAANKRSSTNGLKLDVMEKGAARNKIASFIYDNSLSKLFLAGNKDNIEVKVDSISLKKIRDKCYWGVASGK
jgi:hypothetical protein